KRLAWNGPSPAVRILANVSAHSSSETQAPFGITMLQVTPSIVIHERELSERFVRASGPGGQNVNKVSTAVELRFDVGASSLPEDVKARLRALAGTRITAEGVLIVDSR